jgi:hypothetical protein
MYIGEPSLTKLAAYLRGYDHARSELLAEPADPFFLSFQAWTEHRLQTKYLGWDKAILLQVGSEKDGFDRFWELFDEYMTRHENRTAAAGQPNGPAPTSQTVEKEYQP